MLQQHCTLCGWTESAIQHHCMNFPRFTTPRTTSPPIQGRLCVPHWLDLPHALACNSSLRIIITIGRESCSLSTNNPKPPAKQSSSNKVQLSDTMRHLKPSASLLTSRCRLLVDLAIASSNNSLRTLGGLDIETKSDKDFVV
jgi:hypothetical protein